MNAAFAMNGFTASGVVATAAATLCGRRYTRRSRVAARTAWMGGGGGEEAMGLRESTSLPPILGRHGLSSLEEREKERREECG
jgi:hypothetical protein